MKYLTTAAIALIGLIGLTQGQTLLGARQCVECQYWGGNWCPSTTVTTAPATTSGTCYSSNTNACTTSTGLAVQPSSCVQITGHATKVTCASPDLSITNTSNTRNVTFSQALAANTYCELDLVLSNTTNANAMANYTFTGAGAIKTLQSD